ncbi:hypothetical protein TWF730_002513 [Orbilia blumenaviensis]|uniref:F-box domain-containing protein n=1 Tax=Orbilia blumenaviensis TaxID=1796055 RepID=A0AAV9UAD7_9PEZI
MESSAGPNSSYILNLPAEIISDIVSKLRVEDKVPLLRVCKRFYNIAYPQLWRTLGSYVNYPTSLNPDSRQFNLQKLAQTARDIGVDAMGFHHTKKLIFRRGELGPASDWVNSGLLDIVNDQILAGKLKIRDVEFYWDDPVKHGICTTSSTTPKYEVSARNTILNLLAILKGYARLNLPRRPALKLRQRHAPSYVFPVGVFPLECITRLEIGYDQYDAYSGAPVDRTVKQIQLLTKVLEGTTDLTSLSLSGIRYAVDGPCPISELSGALAKLQDAFDNLKRLSMLELTFMLFHPSLFIIPPINVRILRLAQKVSIEWWRQFARCPFSNVKHLILSTAHIPRTTDGGISKWWSLDGSDMEKHTSEDHPVFNIGRLEIRSLKELSTNPGRYYHPKDLLTLLLEQNPGIEEAQRERYRALELEHRKTMAELASSAPGLV